MDIILKYFPGLSENQINQFRQLEGLYQDWNAKINVISRKDIVHLYEHHILHSLSIAKLFHFNSETRILDIGTGGGFPGIPLAIYFPDVHFTLNDSISKKIKVVSAISEALNLENVKCENIRAEQLKGTFDFIVSRAVSELSVFYSNFSNLISKHSKNDQRNGILYLKGGDLHEELKLLKKSFLIFDLNDIFEEPFFNTKKLIQIY
jgi:16S rRNA (guanine527-N7)-methyltransferase